MTWIIAVPAWGDYATRFVDAALPSYREAMAGADDDFHFIIHTDRPEQIGAALRGLSVEFRPVPPPVGVCGNTKYDCLGTAHRDAIAAAKDGDRVALLCADMVISRETFMACEEQFKGKARAVVVAATPTIAHEGPPPPGLASRDLLKWTMDHAHPLVRECFWGGTTSVPWVVFFRKGDNITMRGFHLHPLAIVKDRNIVFEGTVDQDLLQNFAYDEIHVVTSADEMSAAEMSPLERGTRSLRLTMTIGTIIQWARNRTFPVHWWLSTHRIIIAGNGDTDDQLIWNEVMSQPENPLRLAA